MKRIISLIIGCMVFITLHAQEGELPTQTVKFESTQTEQIRVDAMPIEGVTPVIDWGDGTIVNGEKNWQGQYAFKGIPKGKVTLYGSCKKLELNKESGITSVEFNGQDQMIELTAKNNLLESIDLSSLKALTNLDISNNQLTTIDLSNSEAITYVTASNNKLVGIFMGNNPALRQLTVDNNDLSYLAFTEQMPELRTLNVEKNAVTSLDLSMMPQLRELNINGNGFNTIDLSKVSQLEKLYANGNYFSTIDLSVTPELLNLSLNKNLLTVIDLSANNNLTSVEVAENQLTSLDVTNIMRLKTLNIALNKGITHVDLRQNTYLKTFNADDTALAGLDATNNTSLEFVYLRGTRFSPVALTQFFRTLSGLLWAGWKPNIYLERTSYKGADFDILKDKKFKTDIAEGTDTGKVIQPKKCQIDLQTSLGGSAKLSIGNDELTELPQTIEEGQVVYIDLTLEEDSELQAIKAEVLNEQNELVQLPVLANGFVMEVDTKIIVEFRMKDKRQVQLTFPQSSIGQKVSLTLRQEQASLSDQLIIDWGDGQKVPHDVTKQQDTQSVIEGVIAGTTITIYGAMNKINATEIGLTSIDFTNNPSITEFDLYGNSLTSIDLSNLKDLVVANLAMNSLQSIDLSHNKAIKSLTLYGNSELGTLDLANNKELVELFAKNTGLSSIDLNLPLLEELDLHDNQLTAINLNQLPELIILRLGWNQFKSFGQDTSLPKLKSLAIYHNQLKEITLDGFPQLEWLFVQENPLKGIAIPKGLTLLNKLHVEDCALTACQLDSLYTSLPEWKKPKHDDGEPVRLYNRGQGDQANKASTSTTSIATAKHWTVAAEGDGSGCQPQGIETLRRGHGFNYYSDRDALVIVLSDELRQIPIRLFNVNGHNLFRGERQKEYRIDLRTGQYILTVGNESFKILHKRQ